MNEEKEQLLQRFLDQELSMDEEREALHQIADDPEMRSLLRFDIKVQQSMNRSYDDASSFDVPDDFTDSVMHAIHAADETVPEESRQQKEDNVMWLHKLTKLRTLSYRPVYGIAAALVILAFTFVLMMNGPAPEQAPQTADLKQSYKVQEASQAGSNKVLTRFFYVNGDAHSVAVAGDFSNWEPVPLNKQEIDGKKVWTGLVTLHRGENRYMYVIDGQKWVTDPLAPIHQNDGFGNRNAIINL